MKQTLRFEQLSCRLQVEGLPDVSVGQRGEAIGIITGWSLRWAGRPELEGRKEHLLALMQVVLPYARHLISGVRRRFGGPPLPVEIGPAGATHTLLLRSSQPDTPPLTIGLDDAELADLVRVLDQLRLDPRLQMPLDLPAPQPLKPREVQGRLPRRQRLAAPLGGAVALAFAAGVSLLLPEPRPQPTAAPQAPAAEPDPSPEPPPSP
ncbi:DUF4335 domain-containing protein [Cyanobium sp. LEGE 06113]|uniref:DUF4335 domain-containing protein n=2 Tax=unclassified Cyanobium TaxID=2627006 RepID=UPI00187FCFC9|nr:DUF4335 domain-containing protein [Cyanobium sp. LEGE 06113]MBE9153727.1 DUF4335 domain-containing protein [Cyanobium sp. LEGE 06113]